MSENSKIEWTDHTFNPFFGCSKVSPGCDNCYAEHLMDKRMHKVIWGGTERVRTSAANWRKPILWNRNAEAFFAEHGRRQRVFCASLADVFDNAVPDAWRMDLFKVIADTPALDWLLLTKRIGNVGPYMQRDGLSFDLILSGNVWLGATIVNRPEMLRDAGKLLAVQARTSFWSVEPMLSDLGVIPPDLMPDWVICGGESGRNSRPMHPDWSRSLRDQCAVAGVPFFFKQWGEWAPCEPEQQRALPDSAFVQRPVVSWPDGKLGNGDYRTNGGYGKALFRCGKKAAGRLLDGVTHNAVPTGIRA